jgi:enamine deaminase RidA (YjgF/YER057c/UK114 family)
MSMHGRPAALRILAALTSVVSAYGPRERGADHAVPSIEYVAMPGRADLPFSAAVRVGPMVYLSGQLGTDGTGHLAPGGIGPETARALTNIRRLLEAQGSGMDRVVKCTAMLADMAEWGAMNQEYLRHFPAGLPARSAFGTSGLALGARIELECLTVAGAG